MMNENDSTPYRDSKGDIDIDDQGTLEVLLGWPVVLRLFLILGTPLLVTLFIEVLWIDIVIWCIVLLLFIQSVNTWGYSVISIGLVLLFFYIFILWDSAPRWIAYIISGFTILQYFFIKKRIRDIRSLRRNM